MCAEISVEQLSGTNTVLTRRHLNRSTVWNLVGQAAPIPVALFAVPLLMHGLGTDRFGVLSIAWVFVGYLSLFDLGLGRALTKLVSERLGNGHEDEIPPLIWTGLLIMVLLGLVGSTLVALLSPILLDRVLRVPSVLRTETVHAFHLLALSVPIVTLMVGLRGILEAYGRFDLTNAVRIPMGIMTFAGPVMVLPFSNSISAVVGVLVVVRVIATIAHACQCMRVIPVLKTKLAFRRSLARTLLTFGGWIAVSNVIGPALLYLDRFMIANIISMSAVAYYTAPYDVITKLWIIPTACTGVMFPAFSSTYEQNERHTAKLYRKGSVSVFALMLPLVLLMIAFADKGLRIWLGPEVASHSVRVAQLLALGLLIHSQALVSSALVQAVGRPDLTAKLHLAELPLFVSYLLPLLHAFGIVGAAISWVIRVSISATVLGYVARRLLSSSSRLASSPAGGGA